MADWSNHYERAFADYLRGLGVAWLPVDESRRFSWEGEKSLKSLDFMIVGAARGDLLIDVKGRRARRSHHSLENWATADDVESMAAWQRRFGGAARSLLVFVYQLPDQAAMAAFHDNFARGDRHYGCLAISVEHYVAHLRVRSAKWKTVSVPRDRFRELAQPLSHWLLLSDAR